MYADWHFLWYIFFAGIIFYWKKILKGELKYLMIICLGCLSMVFLLFATDIMAPYVYEGTSIQRFIMHFAPVVLFFILLLTGGEK